MKNEMLDSRTYSQDNLNSSENQLLTAQKVEKNIPEFVPRQQERVLLRERVFKQYLEAKSQFNELIPIEINQKGYAANREEISNELHARFGIYVNPGDLYSGWFGNEIKRLFLLQLKKQKKIKPSLKERQDARAQEIQRQQKYADILERWLKKLKAAGGKLKYGSFAGRTDKAWISEQTGIPYAHLIKSRTISFKVLKKAQKEFGHGNFLTTEEFVLKPHTYQELLNYGTDCRKGELGAGENSQVQVNNTRYALRKFIKVKNLTLETQIGAEFGTLFPEALQEVAATIAISNTRKKFLHELRRWQGFYAGLMQTDNLPPDFPGALKFLIDVSGTTFVEIKSLHSLKKETNGTLISEWVRGVRRPLLENLPLIHKIEDYFHLTRNTLARRIFFRSKDNSTALRKGDFPPLSRSQRANVAKYLPPNFPLLSEEIQKHLVDEIIENLSQKPNDYRKSLKELVKKPYYLNEREFSADLVDEIEKLAEFKTAGVPATGYMRGKRAKWKNDPERRGTIRLFISILECLFGILTLPVEGGGFKVGLSQLTLTLIILPETWRAYLKFTENRRGEVTASYAFRSLSMIRALTHFETGWVTQSSWLADKLEIIPGLLSEQDIKKAKSNWREFLGDRNHELNEIYFGLKSLSDEAPLVRDSHLPILPILENDNPLLLLRNAVDAFEENVHTHYFPPMNNAICFRNVILLRILIETGLRASNLIGITWKNDNSGHLRRSGDGHFYIKIPHSEFKNSTSSYFGPPGRKHPYEVQLSKTLTPQLNEYLSRCRPYLIKLRSKSERESASSIDEGFLFVSNPCGKNQKISYEIASKVVNEFSRTYFVYNPLTKTGIEGVESFGLHSVRHIIATHILKKTGSFAKAGASIQDSELTARRHYARYLPKDRDKKIRHIITDLMEADRE